ncbi:MAG TPA: response regulator, partial [Candidatus Binatia bacterium]|nr:response regulator [Candidatus Binatia bacterium]
MLPVPSHILILEDNPADAVLMVRALRQGGVECTWQRVGTRAEYLAHLGPPYEVILADYNLPEFTAPQALELLNERGWDIPFIMVTGIAAEEAVVACMKEGAADYLLKDRLARLAPAVQSALEQKRLRDEQRQTEAALRASEQRFRALIENSSDAVALITADSILLYVSPSGSRMFGRPWGDRLGRDVFELMHPEDLPAMAVVANHGHSPEQWETPRTLRFPRADLTPLLSQFEQSEVVLLNMPTMRHLPLAALAHQQYGITWALYTPLRRGRA